MNPQDEGLDEGHAVAKMIEGALLVNAQRELPVKIADVHLPVDPKGLYADHFILTTAAGHKIRVSVDLIQAANGDRPEGPTEQELAETYRSLGVTP